MSISSFAVAAPATGLKEPAFAPKAAWLEAVDPKGMTMDLRVRQKRYRFAVASYLVDIRTRDSIDLERLAPDQWIRFISQPRPDGRLEIIEITIVSRANGGPNAANFAGLPDDSGPDTSGTGAGGGGVPPPPPIRIIVTPFQ